MAEKDPHTVPSDRVDRRHAPVYDVFFSYNRQDAKEVRRIAQELENRGLRVWADWKMPSGSLWLTELEKVLKQVKVAVLFVGPSGMGDWHDAERQALHIRRARIIPVFLPGLSADFEPPLLLHRHSWIDLRSEGLTQKQVQRLVEGIRAATADPIEQGIEGPEPERAEPGKEPAERTARGRLILAALALMLAVAGGLAWRSYWPVRSVERPASTSQWQAKVPLPRPSAAVLSFENRSGDRGLDWLGTLWAEAVSAKLGQGGAIKVADREEVALLEADMLLPRRAEVPKEDLLRARRVLGADFLITGGYESIGGVSAMRLDLVLYDAKTGRLLTRKSEAGEKASWLDVAYRAVEGRSPDDSLRRRLGAAPLALEDERHLRSLFPASVQAAELYTQGLDSYRRFEARVAAEHLAKAAAIAPNPWILVGLARSRHFLGLSREAATALERARRLNAQAQGTPAAFTAEEQRRMEVIERKTALDQPGVARSAEALFREFFPDDLGYGLLAVEALVDAGLPEDALALVGELRKLPAAQHSSWLERSEANAFFAQQSYGPAKASAERAVVKARQTGSHRQEALARLLLASILSLTGDVPGSEEQLRLAREGFALTKDRASIAQCLQLRAVLYSNLDLETAADLYREAIVLFEDLGDAKEKAQALFGLSAVLLQKGDEAGAREILSEATVLVSESISGDGPAELNDGVRLHLAGQLNAAQGRYEAARAIFGKLNERDYYATTLANLGEIELVRGEFKNAEELCRQALRDHEKEGVVDGAAFDNVCLGRSQAARGNYIAARPFYEVALRSLRSPSGRTPGEPGTLVEALLAVAELDLHTSRPAEAERRARQAEDIAAGASLPALRSRALALLARSLLFRGRRDEARKAADEAVGLARGDFRAVIEAKLAAARVRAAGGEVAPALAALQEVAMESAKAGMVTYELESLLAAGEIELADGRLNSGRRQLEELRSRAAELGYGQIEKQAVAALGI